jgi:uncharacterized protein
MATEPKPTPPRPVPRPTALTRPFWEAAKEGKFLLQFDRETGQPQFWPRPVSIHSGRTDMEWREVSGRGWLYAWTEVHVPMTGMEALAPYVLAAVELEEGVRVMARLVNVKADALTPGMAVKVAWEKLTDEISLYVFEPA